MLKLYHSPMSTCSQRVRLALAEVDIPWDGQTVNNGAGETRSEEYLQINPRGLLPALIVDGQPIIESAVICEFLAEKYSAPGVIIPIDPYHRAQMRIWTKRPDEGLHTATGVISTAIALIHLVKHMSLDEYETHIAKIPDLARRRRQMDIKKNGLKTAEFAESLNCFELLLSDMSLALEDGPYLAGANFSLADLTFIPYILRLEHLSLKLIWQDYPLVFDWLERMKSRDSYELAIASWFDQKLLDLMRGQGMEAYPVVEQLLRN